jgi:hypothetical protein
MTARDPECVICGSGTRGAVIAGGGTLLGDRSGVRTAARFARASADGLYGQRGAYAVGQGVAQFSA